MEINTDWLKFTFPCNFEEIDETSLKPYKSLIINNDRLTVIFKDDTVFYKDNINSDLIDKLEQTLSKEEFCKILYG